MRHVRRPQSPGRHLSLACLCAIALGAAGEQAYADPSAQLVTKPAVSVHVTIKSRQFLPEIVTLAVGHPVTLVFHNGDSELHVFVPETQSLFAGVNVSVSGNGAPEFDESGFRRVIIPPDGETQVRFTPRQAGTFLYSCDMPGHEMKATIEVRD